jgi:3-phenylpropionate/cinnamic acid dioxygenase small subunit
MSISSEVLPNTELYGRVTRFLYHEAELLDNNRFADWLALLTPEIEYRMPVRTTQFLTDGQGFQDFEFFSDNIESLTTRVRRLETDFAWAEVPPSRPRHYITNVIVEEPADGSGLEVRSNFLVTRTRQDLGYQMFTGVRQDLLVPAGESFAIARRTILIDQTVLAATNLSVLF